jgi:hypothetical protein
VRGVAARLSALALAASLAAGFDADAFRKGVARARGREPGPPTSFAFDPAYRRFLEDVRAATAPGETIRMEIPKSELMILQASYRLAPRRVLPEGVAGEADWVAVYRRVGAGQGTPISGGVLRRGK